METLTDDMYTGTLSYFFNIKTPKFAFLLLKKSKIQLLINPFTVRLEEEMNKDWLLVKWKEVIESLNSEIEEERIAYKILKQESNFQFADNNYPRFLCNHFRIDDRLKAIEDELNKVYSENEDLHRKVVESEKYFHSERISVHKLIDKLNKGMKAEYDPFMWACHELKADGYSSEYKWAYWILKSTLSKEIKRLTGTHSHRVNI